MTAPVPKTEAEAVKQYKAFIHKNVYRFVCYGVPLEELVQEASIAFVLAFRTWSPTGGCSIMSWASAPVHRALCRYITLARRKGFRATGDRSPKARKAKAFPRPPGVDSIDATIPGFDTHPHYDGIELTIHDLIGVWQDHPDYFANQRLVAAMSSLTARERDVIRRRVVDGDELRVIGLDYGLSRERIRQIESEALRKLRARLAHAMGGMAA